MQVSPSLQISIPDTTTMRGILFDYGNTLVNLRDEEDILKEALSDLGHETDHDAARKAIEARRGHWHKRYEELPRGHRWTEEIRIDCQKTGLSAIGLSGDLDAVARAVDQKWESLENRGLYDDVKPALKILDEMRITLGVLSQTKNTGQQLRNQLETFRVAEYFPVVTTSEDAGFDKPDPRLFQVGSEQMGLKNTELCYVGNRYHQDVVGARNAGITPVLVERHPRHKSRDCIVVAGLLSIPPLLRRV